MVIKILLGIMFPPYGIYLIIRYLLKGFFSNLFTSTIEKYEYCPKCNQRNGIDDIIDTKTVSSNHEHERVDGKKDERYKKNDLIDKTEYTYKCKKCGNEFKSVRDEKRGSVDRVVGHLVDINNSSKELNTISESNKKDLESGIFEVDDPEILSSTEYRRNKETIEDEFKETEKRFEDIRNEFKLKFIDKYGNQEGTRIFEIIKKTIDLELGFSWGLDSPDTEYYGIYETHCNYLDSLINQFGILDGINVFDKKLWIGMSDDMVVEVKGNPDHKIEKVSRGKKREEFFYDGYKNRQGNMSYKFRVVLIDGKVDGWNDITN